MHQAGVHGTSINASRQTIKSRATNVGKLSVLTIQMTDAGGLDISVLMAICLQAANLSELQFLDNLALFYSKTCKMKRVIS